MAVRNEIKELFLRAACRVFETTREELSPTEKDSLRANLEARIPLYADRYPILDLVNQFEATADAGHAATVATNATLTHHEGQLQVSPDENSGKSAHRSATNGAKPSRRARPKPPRSTSTTRASASSRASASRLQNTSAAA